MIAYLKAVILNYLKKWYDLYGKMSKRTSRLSLTYVMIWVFMSEFTVK